VLGLVKRTLKLDNALELIVSSLKVGTCGLCRIDVESGGMVVNAQQFQSACLGMESC
jgi:hypothetical protein